MRHAALRIRPGGAGMGNRLFQACCKRHAFRSTGRLFCSTCRPFCPIPGRFCSIPAFHGTSTPAAEAATRGTASRQIHPISRTCAPCPAPLTDPAAAPGPPPEAREHSRARWKRKFPLPAAAPEWPRGADRRAGPAALRDRLAPVGISGLRGADRSSDTAPPDRPGTWRCGGASVAPVSAGHS
jgi:hypothetical protein